MPKQKNESSNRSAGGPNAYRKKPGRDYAIVEIAAGKRVRLPGRFESPESRAAYQRYVNAVRAGRIPTAAEIESLSTPAPAVSDLLLAFMSYAEVRYGQTKEFRHYKILVMKFLRPMFGVSPIAAFGPLKLKSLQQALVDSGVSRSHVNHQVQRARRIFRWGVSEQLVSADILAALVAVEGLRAGETRATNTRKRQPVAWVAVEATLPHLPPVVADMVRFHWHVGARSENVCRIQPAEVDCGGPLWLWQPSRHKTEHLGNSLRIYLGPAAQAVLAPYLERPANQCCFSPRESGRNAGRHYSPDSYRQAIMYALADMAGFRLRENGKLRKPKRSDIEAAGVAYWHPHQLRHAKGHRVRQQFGLEAVQASLGHASIDASEVYSSRLDELAKSVAAATG